MTLGTGTPGGDRRVAGSLTTWIAKGSVAGVPATVSYLGIEDGVRYIAPWVADRVFGQGGNFREVAGDVIERPLQEALSCERSDLVMCTGSHSEIAEIAAVPKLILPFRVHFIADFDDGEARAAHMHIQERKRHVTRVSRFGYSYFVTNNLDAFSWFYRRMHEPAMRNRHGNRARSVEFDSALQSIFRKGFLLLLCSREQPVAGVACHVDDNVSTCYARLAGWLDGDPLWLQRGVLKSINYFLLDWACENGIRRVDFMGCEPFLTKGTFQSKRALGARAITAPSYRNVRLALIFRKGCEVIRSFLIANPMLLAEMDGSLTPGYIYDAARPPRLEIPYRVPGVGKPKVINLDRDL